MRVSCQASRIPYGPLCMKSRVISCKDITVPYHTTYFIMWTCIRYFIYVCTSAAYFITALHSTLTFARHMCAYGSAYRVCTVSTLSPQPLNLSGAVPVVRDPNTPGVRRDGRTVRCDVCGSARGSGSAREQSPSVILYGASAIDP